MLFTVTFPTPSIVGELLAGFARATVENGCQISSTLTQYGVPERKRRPGSPPPLLKKLYLTAVSSKLLSMLSIVVFFLPHEP